MFNSISKFQLSAVSLISASMLLIAGSAIAGPKEDKVKPKKPGPDNILEIALAVNAAAVENEKRPTSCLRLLLTNRGYAPASTTSLSAEERQLARERASHQPE